MACVVCDWAGRRGWPKTAEFAEAMAQHDSEGCSEASE